MIAIVAVAENGGIGCEGKLLFSLPSDMKRFRALTVGKTVVMGRKTLESLPGAKPLKERRNIVLTRGELSVAGAETAHGPEEVLRLIENEKEDEVFLIGGDSVYRTLLPYCQKVYKTCVFSAPKADAFFPELSEKEWKTVKKSEIFHENGVSFQYTDYERV